MINITPSRKSTLIILTVITILYGIWHFIHHHDSSNEADRDSVIVEVTKVKQGTIPIEAQAVGTLVAAKNVLLTPEVPGQVQKILVQDGVFVKEGTPIIQLDDTVNRAKSDSAKAQLTYSSSNYDRLVYLGKKGAISQQAIEQALADFKEKKAIEKETRILAEKMLIDAPFDGVIGKVRVSPGEHVTVGQPVVSLTDVQHLRVEYNVSEKFLSKLAMGQPVTIRTSAYPGQKFYGKVTYIAPIINTEDRTISIYADVPNPEGRLTAGLFVNVMHSLGKDEHVLLIPAVCLVATIDGQQVFKIVNGKAVSVPIEIGLRTERDVQITQGLSVNDLIVIAGQHKIKDGTSVKVKS